MSRTRSALLLTAVCVAATATAACHPRPLATVHLGSGGVHVQTQEPLEGAVTVADRLECPTSIGTLTRTAAAADGASCDYTSDKGLVRLAFAADATDPKAALAPLRTQLDTELPGVAQNATMQVVSEKDADGQERAKIDMPFIHVEDDGRDAAGRKHAKVDMPFLHVEDNGDGRSHVRLMGIDIESHDHDHGRRHHDDADKDDDDDGDASTGAATAAASVAPQMRGVELVYVLVSGKPSAQGFHVAGYIAKGPPKGRLVVATFHYMADDAFNGNRRHHDDDIDQLMALNVKPA